MLLKAQLSLNSKQDFFNQQYTFTVVFQSVVYTPYFLVYLLQLSSSCCTMALCLCSSSCPQMNQALQWHLVHHKQTALKENKPIRHSKQRNIF